MFGLLLYFLILLFIIGSSFVIEILIEKFFDIIGGMLIIDGDVKLFVDKFEVIVNERRR